MSKPKRNHTRLQRIAGRLSGRRVLVTGSSRGIGRETARLLLANGATVILNGRSAKRLAETERELIREFPRGSLSAFSADIANPDAADALARHIRDRWGGLDILINNAGLSMRGGIRELSAETISAMVHGNLLSALHVTRACIPLLSTNRGHITFVSTVGALHGFPGISVYAAAKAALERFSESFNAEYHGTGLSAGIVYLGFVENDPDKEILSADGRPFHHSRKAMQSQSSAASHIITASVKRKRRVITVGLGVILDIMHRIAPGLITGFLGRTGGSIHTVERKPETEKTE